MKLFLTSISMLFVFALVSCKSPQKAISGNYSYKTECLGMENDGSQTVKAWGNGRSRDEAVEDARKTAVRDVMFNGIRNGKPDCNVNPVVGEVNARDKYAEYFNKFFADKGAYTQFISEKYNMEVTIGAKQAGVLETYGVIVRVLRQDLIVKMKNEGILK